MIKIKNAFADVVDYNCFGCGPGNNAGLNMEFWLDDKTVVSLWEPKEQFNGYKNIVHGGIQSTLMDEVASWSVFILLETSGVTSNMNISYKKPVQASNGNLKIEGTILSFDGRIAEIETKLYDGKGILCTEGIVKYYVFDKKKAVEKLGYPGIEKFYEK